MPAVSALYSREKLLQIARSLPADLQVLAALGELLQDVNSELDEIARLLSRDMALAARIVRISNSPMFGGGTRIGSIDEAVNRVGFSEVLKLVGTASTGRFSERALDHYDVSALKLRDAMLYGAFACEALARLMGLDARVAYTAGLLRPIGMVVLDRAGKGQSGMERYDAARFPHFSAWEGGMFGVDNSDVAGMILEEWKFPPEMVLAIRGQYLSRREDFERPLACLINLSGNLALQAGRALPGEVYWWDLCPEKLTGAGLNENDLADAAAVTEKAFETAVAALAL